MWANYRGDLNWGHLKWCLSKVTPPPNPLDSGLGILVSFVYSYHGALMGMGPKSICYHQILPYWGKTIGFHKPLFTKAGYFGGGGYLGEVGWLTSHKSSDFWTLANAPRGLSVPQGTLSLQAARAWRFLCPNSAGRRKEPEVWARRV